MLLHIWSGCGGLFNEVAVADVKRWGRGDAPYRAWSRCSSPRGSGSACESDGDDSDGQGAPQGGGGVQSTLVSARAAEILRGLRGLEASFMIK